MHFPCIHTLFSIYLLYLKCVWSFSDCLFLSLSFLFTLVVSMAPKHKSRPRTLFIPGHHLLLILLLLIFGFMMRMPEKTSRRTFLDKMFIRNVESFWQTSPTLTYPMSFTVEFGSHCVTPRSHVLPC